MSISNADRTAAIKAQALALGFDQVGVTRADLPDSVAGGLSDFLAKGHHGSMDWMRDRASLRQHPQALWPQARSVLAVALNYGPDQDPRPLLDQTSKGNISVYARGKDYHDVLKKRLKRLGRWMAEKYDCELKVFVDTAPVMEKPLASQAGLGWQGKHTNMVSRALGSWTFLGILYTTLDLDPDGPERDHCGTCRACMDACPTNAFPAPYQIDARRCISYLTIEHKGAIPEEFRTKMGNRIYGCDDCLAACPWNKFAETAREAAFHARDTLNAPDLKELLSLGDTGFRALFSGSPIKRIGRNRFVRNCLIAAGNSGDIDLLPQIEALMADTDPVVREAAEWASERLRSTV